MEIARVGLLQLVALVLLVGGVLSGTPLFAQDKPTIGNQPLQEGQRVIRGTISTDASNVRIKVNNQELGGGEVEITHGGGKYRAKLKTPLQEGQKVEVIQVLRGKDSSPAVATVGAPLSPQGKRTNRRFRLKAVEDAQSEKMN